MFAVLVVVTLRYYWLLSPAGSRHKGQVHLFVALGPQLASSCASTLRELTDQAKPRQGLGLTFDSFALSRIHLFRQGTLRKPEQANIISTARRFAVFTTKTVCFSAQQESERSSSPGSLVACVRREGRGVSVPANDMSDGRLSSQ